MRIVHFHTALPRPGRKPGGVEVAVHELAQAASRAGDEVTVLSLGPAPPDAVYRHRRLFPRAGWLGERKLARWLLLPALLNVVRVGPADVVHLHGDDWFLLRRPWPTVRTFYGSALREAQAATSWRRRIAFRLLHPLERLAGWLAGDTAAIDDDGRTLLRARRTIGLGVDLDRFHPGQEAARPTVLFVGTWEGRKRGRLVFDAFTRDVLPALPDAELHLVTDEAAAHPSVERHPSPDPDEIAALYRSAWVFAYPSTYEGFGLPYLEAMASGTAVVATPIPAARRLLGDGARGVLADDAELGPALARLLGDPAARARLANAGRSYAVHHSWGVVAARYREVYDAARRRPVGGRATPPVGP
jgi:glycosyltransferase involved in cell wall biosynthesis